MMSGPRASHPVERPFEVSARFGVLRVALGLVSQQVSAPENEMVQSDVQQRIRLGSPLPEPLAPSQNPPIVAHGEEEVAVPEAFDGVQQRSGRLELLLESLRLLEDAPSLVE